MVVFDWGNIVINGAMLTVVAFFVKKWMSDTEKTVRATASALAAVTVQHSQEISAVTERNRDEVRETADALAIDLKRSAEEHRESAKKIAEDLQQSIKERREEIKETHRDLSTHLDKIYDQLRIANGRTSKIEGGLETIKAVCKERHEGNGK